jgi:hypothetical protein
MADHRKMHGPTEAAEGRGVKFRRWLSGCRLPLVSTVAASMLIGAAALSLPDTRSGTDYPALCRRGNIGKGGMTLDEKLSAWHHCLGFGKGCNPAGFLGILSEIRAEEERLMQAGDTKGLIRLFEIERAAAEIYRSDVRDPTCAQAAKKKE